MTAEKEQSLDLAIAGIEKQFGKGAIMRLGENARFRVNAVPTGILPLDIALGVGGLPRGRVVEVYGPEASGKTTVALTCVARIQDEGGIAAFIDAEHALDPAYASRIGVVVDDLLVSQPDSGEQALEIAEHLVRSGAVEMVVVDSVAALVPRAELAGEMGETHLGLQARLMSQALRKLTAAMGKSNAIVIFINQLRERVGVMFGSAEITTGGRALRFYASVRVEIRRVEAIRIDAIEVGSRVRAKVVKNKVAPPFKTAEFDLVFGKGVSIEGCLLDLGMELGFVTKRESGFGFEKEALGHGRQGAMKILRDRPDLAARLEQRIRERVLPKIADNPPPTEL